MDSGTPRRQRRSRGSKGRAILEAVGASQTLASQTAPTAFVTHAKNDLAVISDGVRRGRPVTRVIYGEGEFTLLDAEMADENPGERDNEEFHVVCLDCLLDQHPEAGAGMDIARRGLLSLPRGDLAGGDHVTLKFCLDCNGHHDSAYSCPQREARHYRTSAARKARGRHAWRLARTAARQRDGQRCRGCGGTQRLQVHHVIPISEGGERYALSNLVTLCRDCHNARHGGGRGSTENEAALPRASFSGETPEPRPRFSRSVLRNVPRDDEGPLIG
jgi:HNH endonuclease